MDLQVLRRNLPRGLQAERLELWPEAELMPAVNPDSIFRHGLTGRQRWNRFKWKVLRICPAIVLEDNPLSLTLYFMEMEAKYGEGWL